MNGLLEGFRSFARLTLAALLLLVTPFATAIDFTDGYTLRAETGEQVGVLVGLPSFKPGHGKCVLMLAPATPELAKSLLGLAISEGKNAGQLTWDKLEPALVVRNRGMTFLKITDDGQVIDALGRVIGSAEAMPEKKK